jgi:hypothetical protein
MKNIKKILYNLILLAAIPITFLSSAPVMAVFDETFFAENNIIYYDPDGREYAEDCFGGISTGAEDGSQVTIIGDSITNGSLSELQSKLPGAEIIAQDSKQFDGVNSANPTGVEIAKTTLLRQYVVFALGTNNRNLTNDNIENAVNAIGSGKQIIFVTNYGLTGSPNADYSNNNSIINQAAQDYSNVTIADWATSVNVNPTKYITNADGLGVHPTQEGKKLFAEVIAGALSNNNFTTSAPINANYAGIQVFNDAQLGAIEANRPFYEKAASANGFPWQILAVLHMREHSLQRDNPSNGQGAYQLYSYTGGGSNANAFLPSGPINDTEFQRQTDIAADIVKSYGLDLSNPDQIKLLFFKYNGTASVYKNQAKAIGFSDEQANNGEGSPYVMNRFDAKRDPTVEPTKSNNTWGQIKRDGGPIEYPANSQFGAFVQYTAIAGGMSNNCTMNNGNINETALLLSWEDRTHDMYDLKPTYDTAISQVGFDGYGCPPRGASCDLFVATVMRYSGADPEYPCCSTTYTQLPYLENNPKYQEIIHNNDPSVLQPGDIFITPGHTFLYVILEDGTAGTASASCSDRTADHGHKGIYFQDSTQSQGTRYYRVFRRTNGGV